MNASRGFRAPHMTYLGTLGLTGSGFEVSAPDVAGRNGTVGSTADATAVSTGDTVVQLVPESSVNVDGSVRRSANPAARLDGLRRRFADRPGTSAARHPRNSIGSNTTTTTTTTAARDRTTLAS